MKPKVKGTFTFKSAGVLFALSALLEIFSITSPIPLAGAVRGGVWAGAYHLTYGMLYFILGFGLFMARPWAYRLVFAVTGFYTLDRLVYLLDRKALGLYFLEQLGSRREIFQALDPVLIVRIMMLATLLIIACWWGFAGYTYLRRAYFQSGGAGEHPNQNAGEGRPELAFKEETGQEKSNG